MYLQCETLIEEHEETLIELFQESEDSVLSDLCVDVIGLCLELSAVNLSTISTCAAKQYCANVVTEL